MKLTNAFKSFFKGEQIGGVILIFSTIISLLISNSQFSTNYQLLWEKQIGHHTFSEWINDALMAVFFLLVGLELKREILIGELSNFKKASLPVIGAFGGMIVPAVIYAFINFGSKTISGSGIPMATDIAFAIGVLSLLGNRVPIALKVFLTALAVIDDLGAIFVIAIFYTKSLSLANLIYALLTFILLVILNKLKVRILTVYLIVGAILWYFMSKSGVHATISGVLLAFAIPFQDGQINSLSSVVEKSIHKPVIFIILPLFAMSNTAIQIPSDWLSNLANQSNIGIAMGLIIGKPIGIFMFSYISVKIHLCELSNGVKFTHLFGAGMLGGIGFTMSIFITLLAFTDPILIQNAKMAILISSTIASIIGYFYLSKTLNSND